MPSRTFHVLYVPEGLVADCINAIRVFANPAEKHRAHITVRGPYYRSGNQVSTTSRLIEGAEINIRGPGNFLDSGQNTVFLRCESPSLENAWYKPDYEFNPHITLYDGVSCEFARKLWEIVSRRTYEFSFVAGPLVPLVSSRRGQGGMELRADLNLQLLQMVTGLNINGQTIESLGQDARLEAIGKLCDYLSTVDCQIALSRQEPSIYEGANLEIKEVSAASPVLAGIKSLARKNSTTLGFLPEGAFDAYAQRGWVLAAIADGEVVGYVVYRVSNMKAVLVHLCTTESQRGQGIARQLFRSVVSRTSDLRGILANTRRDFPAHAMWPKLGFSAIGENPGRGLKTTVLTRWWYEHPHPTLFSYSASYQGTQSQIDVAIDLNVFYDLVLPESRGNGEESRLLQSDWLTDEVQLCVTGEIFNEITRLTNANARQWQRTLAHQFKRISGETEKFEKAYSLLSSIIGAAINDRQSSDLRHLAHTVAADVEFFVTRDEGVLRFDKEIEAETGVCPIRPLDLVIEIDRIRNTASYQPERLRGSNVQIVKVDRHQRKELEDVFVNNALGEKKSLFRRRLSSILPPQSDVNTSAIMNDGQPVALLALKRLNLNVLVVPCLRLRHGRLARTLARHLVTIIIEASIKRDCSITEVTDDWLDPYVEEALSEGGFVKSGVKWLKLNYSAIGTQEDVSAGLAVIAKEVEDLGLELPGAKKLFSQAECRLTASETVLIEKNLRPLKLTNDVLETLVIPVMPRWAQHLFDSNLAEQTLLGARPELVLNWENAYYRSPRSLGKASAPFRILWYVSRDSRYVGTSQIRAYSVASNVEVLPARLAYDGYKRLGVYEWEQVLRITGGDPEGLVMVVRFCDIEVFKNPISRNRFSELLAMSDQKKPSLRGPQRISESAFAAIYSEGQL